MDEYNLTIVNIILKHFEEFIEYGGTVAGKREIKFAEHVNNKKCKCDNELLKTKLGETVRPFQSPWTLFLPSTAEEVYFHGILPLPMLWGSPD